jgi:hypothetical protein
MVERGCGTAELQDGLAGWWRCWLGELEDLGGFGGVIACETTEPDYIWRCNITKMSPTFHCGMHGWQGVMVN